jgi:hypothetical protein
LSHLLVKGYKGDFMPVISWLKEIYDNTEEFADLLKCEDTSDATKMILNTFKGGLYSKSIDVTKMTCKIYTKLGLELNLEQDVYDWFVAADGGLDGTLCANENHKSIEQELAEFYLTIGKFNLCELFTQRIKEHIKDELKCGLFISRLTDPIIELYSRIDNRSQKSMYECMKYFIEIFCGMADNDGRHNPSQRATALGIICKIWIAFPGQIEEKSEIANYVTTLLSRAIRDTNQSLQIYALTLLFMLIETFAPSKKQYAPVIYRLIAISLSENVCSTEIRHFIMKNLQMLYVFQPGIPIQILIDPYSRQIQQRENFMNLLNIFDFQFLQILSAHPKLNSACAFQILDICGKSLISDLLLGVCADRLMLPLMFIARGNSLIIQFLTNVTKVWV